MKCARTLTIKEMYGTCNVTPIFVSWALSNLSFSLTYWGHICGCFSQLYICCSMFVLYFQLSEQYLYFMFPLLHVMISHAYCP
jgi:hypothetical protein